jgi:hypothetical protein
VLWKKRLQFSNENKIWQEDNFEVLAHLRFIGNNESIRASMEIESSRDTNPDTQAHIKYQELSGFFTRAHSMFQTGTVKEPASLV